MAALLPTPSSDRDPGSRQRPGRPQLPSRCSNDLFAISALDHREGRLKERAVSGAYLPFFPLFFRNASLPCSSFAFSFLLSTLLYLSHLSLVPAPFYLFSFFFLFLPSFPSLPPLFLIPALLISLPQHPVPSLWCVLVLATARPGRTDGYLLRQRSPWAPTPFPPPGAAQVSR